MKIRALVGFAVALVVLSACAYLPVAQAPKGIANQGNQPVAVATAAAAAAAIAHDGDGDCGPSNLAPLDSKHNTVGWGGPELQPILAFGTATTAVEVRSLDFDYRAPTDVPGNRALQAMLYDKPEDMIADVRAYYSVEAIGDKDTLADLYEAGGIMVVEQLPQGTTAAQMFKVLGDRATSVDIASYTGVLTWADPMYGSDSVRPFDLFLNDGTHDVNVIGATAGPDAIVDMARSMYCG